jgi:hypothetical protein
MVAVVVMLVAAACSDDGAGDDQAEDDGTNPSSATTGGPSTSEPGPDGEGADLTLIDLNMLHGLNLDGDCPPETDSCAAATRLAILWEQVEAAGCPDVITLQEVGPAQRELIPAELPELCDGAYELASEWVGLPVEVAIITSLPVLDHAGTRMSGINWAAQWAKLDAGELGAVEVATAHFASTADPFACADGEDYCKELCDQQGTPGDCHPLELLAMFQQGEDDDRDALQIATGDFNKPPGDPRIMTLTDAGFVDTWLLAGNPECDPSTGEGCTCCVAGDGPLVGLDVADQPSISGRIDFVLARAPASCDLRADTPDDGDGDGTSSGPFAREPRAEALDGVYWSSDHTGVQVDLWCEAGS